MIIRTVALSAIAFGLTLAGVAEAKDTNKDRLRKLLEKKYGERAKSRARPAEPRDDQELYIIDKRGKVRSISPSKRKNNDSRSSITGLSTAHAGTVGRPDRNSRNVASAPKSYLGLSEQNGLSRHGAGAVHLAQKSGETIVRSDLIVIQFKPSATGAQMDALERKYNLKVVERAPNLGAVIVKVQRTTRRTEKPSIEQILEPPIVRRLRREPAVNAAFVKSTIRHQSLPMPSSAKVEHGANALKWHWHTGSTDDGNWGLKSMRMPAVWTILSRARLARGGPRPTPVAILDSGFGKHPQLTFANVMGKLPPRPVPANCALSHGTHVAGIIAAHSGSGKGIDGIAPKSRLDLVPISRSDMLESLAAGLERPQLHMSYFFDAILDLGQYFADFPLGENERRVVNVSLAYNWEWVRKFKNVNPRTDKAIRAQIRDHAKFIQFVIDEQRDNVLFVSAAGNDSLAGENPFEAKLATPFAYAALHKTQAFVPSEHIVVVEAHDRSFRRAQFSNVGGHVAAPGVEVLSTLASDNEPYGACSGTSQAAPHVTALAAILFELAPAMKPKEIIDVILSSAVAETGSASASRIDALAAIAALPGNQLRYLADLNNDNVVNKHDLEIFKQKMVVIESGRFGARIKEDLNDDGVVDNTERCWPLIDLNGSGRASYDANDQRLIAGTMRSDLDVIQLAWTDQSQGYASALQQSRIGELISVWRETSIVAAQPLVGPPVPCQ